MTTIRHLAGSPRWSQRLSSIKNTRLLGSKYGNTQLVYQTTYTVGKNESAREPLNSLRPFEDIPRDRRLPIISSMKDLYGLMTGRKLSRIHIEHYDAFRYHGGIAVYQILNKKMVIISDPEICAEICRQEDETPRRKEVFERILGAQIESRQLHNMPSGISAREGKEWLELRKVFNKALLDPKAVKNYFDGFDDIAQLVVTHLKEKSGESGMIENMLPILERWAIESFGTFSFGKNVGLFSDVKNEQMERCFAIMGDYLDVSQMLSANPIMKKLFRKKYFAFHAKTKEILDVTSEMMKDEVKTLLDDSSNEGTSQTLLDKSFLAYLLRKNKIPSENAIIYALDTFRASLDTTSTTAAWLLYLLGTHPEVQEKLHEEIQRNMSADGKVDYNTMQRMPYLRACMKEQMRLYPSSATIPRTFLKSISAGGYEIPEKTMILISMYNMGRQEKCFEDALTFLPERWLREKDRGPEDKVFERPHPFSSLPFGQGARSCVGRRVAEAELQTLFAHLVKNFKFRYVGPKATGTSKMMYTIEHPLALKLERRV